MGISKLTSMAPELAVYASPGESPHSGARLASRCWSDSPGRALHPQGSDERFPICFLHLVLLSQASLGAIPFSSPALARHSRPPSGLLFPGLHQRPFHHGRGRARAAAAGQRHAARVGGGQRDRERRAAWPGRRAQPDDGGTRRLPAPQGHDRRVHEPLPDELRSVERGVAGPADRAGRAVLLVPLTSISPATLATARIESAKSLPTMTTES